MLPGRRGSLVPGWELVSLRRARLTLGKPWDPGGLEKASVGRDWTCGGGKAPGVVIALAVSFTLLNHFLKKTLLVSRLGRFCWLPTVTQLSVGNWALNPGQPAPSPFSFQNKMQPLQEVGRRGGQALLRLHVFGHRCAEAAAVVTEGHSQVQEI